MNKSKRAKKPFPWTCTTCRSPSVHEGAVDYQTDLEFDGRTYHICIENLKTPRCLMCGAICLDSEADEQITAAFLRQAKLLTPRKIRTYRERLGLSPKELANSVGITEEKIVRFESGLQFPQRTEDNVLRLFFGSPEARELLTKRKLSRVGLVTKRPAKAAS